MVINKFKKGYTLFEACVVMVIVSIFIMVMANVIPHKVKDKVESNSHGHFECYFRPSDGHLIQQTFIEGNVGEAEDRTAQGFDYCSFIPQNYSRFLIFNAVGGGAINSAGRFGSTFFNSSISNSYKIYPGAGGEDTGGDTIVKNSEDEEIMHVGGGIDATNPANASIDDVSSCVISSTIPRTYYAGAPFSENAYYYDQDYVRERGPVCEVENGKVKVSFCRTNEFYGTSYLPYKSTSGDTSDYLQSQFVAESPYPSNHWDVNNKRLNYCNTSLFEDYGNEPYDGWLVNNNCESNNDVYPSLYKMTLTLDLNYGTGSSLMSNYIRMLQYNESEDPIVGITPGPGDGVASGTGGTGAVLILW